MLDAIKDFLSDMTGDTPTEPEQRTIDKNLAAAALMVQVMAADGIVRPEEEAKLIAVLEAHYEVDKASAKTLAENARTAQENSVDLYSFTSVLKREMSEDERLGLVEDLWEMVYADGELHEFEDNVVWRVAELIGVQARSRMELKQRVLSRQS